MDVVLVCTVSFIVALQHSLAPIENTAVSGFIIVNLYVKNKISLLADNAFTGLCVFTIFTDVYRLSSLLNVAQCQ